MEKRLKNCPACGQLTAIYGQQGKCPNCNATVTYESAMPVGAPPPPPPPPGWPSPQPAAQRVPAPPPPPLRLAGDALFPERMKANKALAGRVCPSCSQQIELGDDVWNCPACRGTMHQACRESAGGCASPVCAARQQPALPLLPAAPAAQESGDLVPCRFCGEKILRLARKCRLCGEFQSDAERAARERKSKQADQDESLSTGEIIFGILCAGIACIVAIVWLIQGKKKGWKLLLISVIAQLVFGLIRAMTL